MKVFGAAALLVTFVTPAAANTEKTIFLGPSTIDASRDAHEKLQKLRLIELSPAEPSQRLSVLAAFPSAELPSGVDSWYLLRGLEERQRYEVRVCWSATQPTVFNLDTFDTTHALQDSVLMHSLSAHSASLERDKSSNATKRVEEFPVVRGALLLRLQAAADFYTTNNELMRNPPKVDIDLILDPFLLGVLPRSLVPTIAYVLVVALAGTFVADYIWRHLYGSTRPVKDRTD